MNKGNEIDKPSADVYVRQGGGPGCFTYPPKGEPGYEKLNAQGKKVADYFAANPGTREGFFTFAELGIDFDWAEISERWNAPRKALEKRHL